MNRRAFGQLLAEQGLVADPALPEPDAAAIPAVVKLLSGVGAWLASFFVLSSLFAAALPALQGAAGRAGAGAAICALCAWGARVRPPGPFIAQLLTATSLAGAGLLVSAVFDVPGLEVAGRLLACALLAAALLLANPEPVHRLLMAMASAAFLAAAAVMAGLVPVACIALAVACSWLWNRQAALARAGLRALSAPVGDAAALLLILLPFFAPGSTGDQVGSAFGPLLSGRQAVGDATTPWLEVVQPAWLTPVGLALVLGATALVIVRSHRVQAPGASAAGIGHGVVALAVAAAIAGSVLFAEQQTAAGLLACLLVWTLGVGAGRPWLRGAGIVGLAFYLVQLYYDLHYTLQGKGIALIGSGMLMVLLHFLLARWPWQVDAPAPPGDPASRRQDD
jgi:hypothetical protein